MDPDEFLATFWVFHLLGIISFPYFDQELSMGDQWKPDDKPVFTNHDVLYQQATKILEVIYRKLEKTSLEPDASESLSRLQNRGWLDTDTLVFLMFQISWGLHWFPCLPPNRMRTSERAAGTGRPTYFILSCLSACEEEPVIFTEGALTFTFCLDLSLADGNKFHDVLWDYSSYDCTSWRSELFNSREHRGRWEFVSGYSGI